MKTRFILSTLAILAIAAFGSPVFAQTDGAGGFGYMVGGFLDENGDGFNDLAPDADGDGIPNGLDPDYAPPMDGTGSRLGADNGNGEGAGDGEGFIYRHNYKWNHRVGATGSGFGPGDGTGFGPGDGTGNGGEGPGDGTGFGPGDGTCTPALDGNGRGGRN